MMAYKAHFGTALRMTFRHNASELLTLCGKSSVDI